MKIHIFGCSGSGKTWLANKLSEEYGLLHYDLDNIFWDNTKGSYGIRMPVEKRSELLRDMLKQDSWIIEGVYYAWLCESFEQADKIIVLDIRPRVYKYRIIRRFLRRKLGIEGGKKETLKSLSELLKWTDHFRSTNYPEALNSMQPYRDKIVRLTSKKAIAEFTLDAKTR